MRTSASTPPRPRGARNNRARPNPGADPMSIEINNESGVEVDEASLAELGRFVLDAMHVDRLADLSILLLDVEAMTALHVQWMDLPGPTDVMAFPMDAADGPIDRLDPSAPPPTDDGAGQA